MVKQYKKGRVSVITPVYNSERHLMDYFESIFSQSYEDIEIVLVDDCSTDNSGKIIKDQKKKHKNIVYFCQEKNMGAGVARNKALELATGQYVAFLDSDDMWYSDKTLKQIELMKVKDTPFSYTAIEMIDDKNKLIKGKRKIKTSCDYKYLLRNTIIATSSVIIDRDVLGDFRMHLRRGGQDYATWLKLLRNNVVAYGIDETLVKYRVSKNSLSSNKFKSIKQVWEIQTQDEKINGFMAIINVICFAFNAFKKYFM